MKRLVLQAIAIISVLVVVRAAQLSVVPIDEEQGHVALGLALRHLGNVGIFMQTTAHPDDENNGLLVMLNRGQGYRTALATATRGNGGQNEIGPEIFEALGVLRTEELAALHRFDGADQYFTRAVDFGYSFSIDETFEKWGRDEITADYVRLMRMIRPDVVIGMMPGGAGGGQHHQASALITREAVKLAADPTKFPEQIKEGLHPWQPRKFYYTAAFGFPGETVTGKALRINLAVYDRLLGRTYAEVGTEARSMHKCQGMAQLLSLPGPASSAYQLVESSIPNQIEKDETSLFDAVDTTIPGLAKFAGPRVPRELNEGLAAVASSVQAAQRAFEAVAGEAALKPLVEGLVATRALLRAVGAMTIDETAKYEIDFRLRQKEAEFQQAILLANAVRVEALADDGMVVPGQATRVSVIVANRGGAPVSVKQVKFDGFETAAGSADHACTLTPVTAPQGFGGGGRGRGNAARPAGPPISALARDQVGQCDARLTIPATAKITEPYWHRKGEEGRYTFDRDAPFGLPFRPTPFSVRVTLGVPGGGNGPDGQTSVDVVSELPVQHRYEGNIFSGEKRTELLVVPALSVRVTPEIAIIPAASISSGRASRGAPSSERDIRVTVVNDMPSAAQASLRLELPGGWTAVPAEQTLKFDREDQALTVRFNVKPGVNTPAGEAHVRAVASVGAQSFDRGYQVVEYPHIRRYHIYDTARATIKVIDVRTLPNLTIGYVMGVGDQVPPAIEQLGARVEMIGPDDLAWGNLSRFDAIVTGVRAYERREDLRANNARLLEYVFNGGTAIVQYNKFEFNEAQYGPYPARVSSNRVTDESAPTRVLAPRDPLFTTPNEISEDAWKGWVQERGLYFLGDKDARYRDLVELQDPFPNNPGPKSGALVETSYGKGRWVYVGLGLWRQLPAGTDGAYQLLANLISLGRSAKTASSR